MENGRIGCPQFSPVLDDPALPCEGEAMCNHYRKDQKVIEWSVSRIPRVRIPAPMEPLPEHTYPKYPAPVVIEEAGERTLVAIRWGLRAAFSCEGQAGRVAMLLPRSRAVETLAEGLHRLG